MIEDWNSYWRGQGSRRVTRAIVCLGVCGVAAQLIGQYQVNMGGFDTARNRSGTIRYSQVHSPKWSAAWTQKRAQRRSTEWRVAGAPRYGRYGTRRSQNYKRAPGYRSRPGIHTQGGSQGIVRAPAFTPTVPARTAWVHHDTRSMGTFRYGAATSTRGLSRSSGYGRTSSSQGWASRSRSKGSIRY